MNLISSSIRGLIRLFLGFVLVYTLITLAALNISPEEIPLLAFFPMGYPIVVLLLTLLLPFSLFNGTKNAFLNTALLAVGFYLLVDFVVFQKPDKEEPGSLKVLTYNVRNFNRWKWIEKDNVRDSIFQLIDNQNPDIAFFQEFHFKKTQIEELQKLADRLDMPYLAYNDMQGREDFLGLFTMSRYPLKVVDRNDFGTRKFTGNGLLVSDVFTPTDTIRTCNFHAGSLKLNSEDYELIAGKQSEPTEEEWANLFKRFYLGFKQKGKQVAFLENALKESDMPTILAGDANDIPFGFFYKTVSNYLNDSFIEQGKGIGHTYSGTIPFLRIDYVFASSDFEVRSHEVVKEKLSDHYPVVVSLEVKN